MAVNYYGQVGHGLENIGHLLANSEVFEFCEALSLYGKGKPDGLVDFEGAKLQGPVEEWPMRLGKTLCCSEDIRTGRRTQLASLLGAGSWEWRPRVKATYRLTTSAKPSNSIFSSPPS
jgi:hypothetical protein